MLCATCEIISICTICVDFGGQENLRSIEFECPSCFLKRDSNAVYVCQPLNLLLTVFKCHLAIRLSCSLFYPRILAKNSDQPCCCYIHSSGGDG